MTRPQSDARVERWLEDANDDDLYLSAISLGELVKGIGVLPIGARRRNELQLWLDESLHPWFAGRILAVDEKVAERWGALAALVPSQGRHLSVTDGLIAATALEHDLTLVTRNVKDFASLGLSVLNPWDS